MPPDIPANLILPRKKNIVNKCGNLKCLMIVAKNIIDVWNRYENFDYTKPKCRTPEEWLSTISSCRLKNVRYVKVRKVFKTMNCPFFTYKKR